MFYAALKGPVNYCTKENIIKTLDMGSTRMSKGSVFVSLQKPTINTALRKSLNIQKLA